MNTPPISNNSALLSGKSVPQQTLNSLLHAGVLAWPDKTAVIHNTGELSYKELENSANSIASGLLKTGVVPGDRVGVLLRRTELLVPSLLGILKIGAAYVPLDSSYPLQRLKTTLQNAQVKCLLATPDLAIEWNETSTLFDPTHAQSDTGHRTPALPTTDTLTANLIYTSGTTGTPKGVCVSRAAIANLLVALQDTPGLVNGDRVLGLATIAFDIHVLELLAPLAAGATIVLADDATITDPRALLELIERTGVTLVQATPSMWGVLIAAGLPHLPHTRCIAGGERLAPATALELTRRLHSCWNMYGPTEATVYTTAKLLTENTRVSIGTPLANISVAVMQQGTPGKLAGSLALAETGELGELVIMGAGLADGYWQNEAATKDRFVQLMLGNQPVKAYLTGDLAFIDQSGDVHCQGRLDQQIKLRGHRIELSEIEHALMTHPELAEAACSIHSYAQDDDRLVAYHTNANLASTELRDFLDLRLPPYMVPQRFVFLAQLPRLPSGKLDRATLPRPQLQADLRVVDHEVLGSADLHALATIWQSLLGGTIPENEHNFMDQGGHSLLALRLVREIAQDTGKELPVRMVVLENFSALVAHLEGQQGTASTSKSGIFAALIQRIKRITQRA